MLCPKRCRPRPTVASRRSTVSLKSIRRTTRAPTPWSSSPATRSCSPRDPSTEVVDRGANGFGGAGQPDLLRWLAGPGGAIGSHDAVLVARGTGGRTVNGLAARDDLDAHPRVVRARRHRRNVRVFGDERGLVTLGHGLVGRLEISVELLGTATASSGAGRELIAAGLDQAPAGAVVWAQVAPGNAASLRAFLGAGFTPVAAEVLIHPSPRAVKVQVDGLIDRLSPNCHATRLPARHVGPLDKALVSAVSHQRSRENMRPEIVIRGGTVVDGTGAPAFVADVAISGDVISEIARLDDGGVQEVGRREIDAEGRLVTPGFVDIHTHLDAQIAWDPIGTSSCWHGVTSVVMGNCGVTFAPCKPADRACWRR